MCAEWHEKEQPDGQMENVSPQFGNHTLSDLKRSILQETMELITRAVIGGMVGIYLEDGLPLYFISDQLLDCLNYTYQEFIAKTDGVFLRAMHPDDRADYLRATTEVVENGKFEQVCRFYTRNGKERWMRVIGNRAMIKERAVLLMLCMDVTEPVRERIKLEQKATAFQEDAQKLASLMINIPGGVCEVALDDAFTLLYGNEGFYTLYAYTPKQLQEEKKNSLLELIYPEDRASVQKCIHAAYQGNEKGFEFERRILRGDGCILWVLVRGNYSTIQDRTALSCVVIDITDRKKMEQKLQMNEERLRIALAQTENSIFDYDIRTRTMIHGDKSAESYGLTRITENMPEALVEKGMIHPESIDDFRKMYERIHQGMPVASCSIRARLANGQYVWRKISMNAIADENGVPLRAIGVLEDIDERTRREQSLLRQSERDALTSLYNRGATESRITEFLRVQHTGTLNAMFIIDIDLFKAVNDHYGHLFGDFVLTESANRIARLFHAQDVIGRIGGDEFIVFMCNLPTPGIARKRAQQICRVFQMPFTSGKISAEVSCSIGIAFCPEHGTLFPELYEKADIALYAAKRGGKNQAVRFAPQMRIEDKWIPYSNTTIDAPENH